MILDSISVQFENAATDALGYEHVDGKLYCGRDRVELQFKERDRAFKKTDPITVEFEYTEIEKIIFHGGWFRPKILEVNTRSPEKLKDFPGANVGKVELQVTKQSISDAKKVAHFIDYKQSEAYLRESDERLGDKRGGLESGI